MQPASLAFALACVAPLAAQCELSHLLSSDLALRDSFGLELAIDGERAVVGAIWDDSGGADEGAVYVFDAVGSTWTQSAELFASDGASADLFGRSVDVSGDVVVVGANYHDGVGLDSGAAYVFELIGAAWMQTAKLDAFDGATKDEFGISVAVSGTTIVVGAFGQDSLATDAGAAYVFDRVGSTWTFTAKLVGTGLTSYDGFGTAVAIDGDELVVGAPYHDALGSSAGAAYVFRRASGVWSELQTLLASDGTTRDYFGEDVDVQGATVVAGAHLADAPALDSGAAYAFRWNGTSYAESAKLVPADGAQLDTFGDAVRVSPDEATIVVGAPDDDDTGASAGSAYVFAWNGATFVESSKLTASDGAANDDFGRFLALDGDRLLIAAPSADTGGYDSGAVYVFSLAGSGCATLDADTSALSLFSGGAQTLTLQPGASWAGAWYWVVGSASGTSPGIPLGVLTVPLNFDPWMQLTLTSPGTPPLLSTVSTLDAFGVGTAQIVVAAGTDPSLLGLHFDHAFVLFDPTVGSVDFVSNPRGLDLLP